MKVTWEMGLLTHTEHDSKQSTCRAWVFCKHLLVQWKKLYVLGV